MIGKLSRIFLGVMTNKITTGLRGHEIILLPLRKFMIKAYGINLHYS